MHHENIPLSMVETHMKKIFAWALRKTGDAYAAEDLAQEVFTQFFIAVAKAETVKEPEHLLWKVAHYCWCNYLRRKTKEAHQEILDDTVAVPTDFVTEMAANQHLTGQIQIMRQKISNLSYIQREAMIQHYLEELPIAQVAENLGTTVNAVTWHLFDARKKVKEELERMAVSSPEITYLYRPAHLNVGLSGYPGPDPDTKRLQDSLIRQNLCLLCFRQPQSLDELVRQTGIPKPYLEYDLEWLVNREFLILQGKKYSTAFPIISAKHRRDIAALYADTRPEFIDRIIDTLWEQEKAIRQIGFYGCDFPTERLMWAIITLYISYVSRNSPLLTRLKAMDNRPIRPDGGRYIVMAGHHEDSDGCREDILWGGYYGICSDSCMPVTGPGSRSETYYWLGVNCFAEAAYHPAIIHAGDSKRTLLHWIYTSVTESWFSEDKLEPHGKQALAEAVAEGLITKQGAQYIPHFVIFSPEELCKLQEDIYRPLMEATEPILTELGNRIASMHEAAFPRINKSDVDYHTYADLWDFGIYTLMYAAHDGKLWMPERPEQGTPLTLILVR